MGNLSAIAVLTGTLFAVGMLPIVRLGVSWRRADPLEPIYLSALYFLLIFPIRSLYALIFGTPFLGEPPFDPETRQAWILALVYLMLAFAVFLLGYHAPVGPALAEALPSLPSEWSWDRSTPVMLTLAAMGGIAFAGIVHYFGGIETYLTRKQLALTAGGTTYLYQLVGCLSLSATVAYMRWLRLRRGRGIFLILLASSLAVGATTGSKGAFLFPLFGILVVRHYLKVRIGMKEMLVATGVIIGLIPAFNIYRHLDTVTSWWPAYINVMTEPSTLLRHLMNRFHDLDAVIYIIRDTPGVMDYQVGRTLAPLIISWIPRAIWPEKPVISFGKVFGETYWAPWFKGTGSAPSITVLGEGYLNFHVVGMTLVAFVSGITLRAAYHYLIRRRSVASSGVLVYSYIVFPYLAMFWESDIAGLVSRAMFSTFLAIVVSLFLGKKAEKYADLGRL